MKKYYSKKNKIYGLDNPLQDSPPSTVVAARDPTATDTGHNQGTSWINELTNDVWMLTSVSAGSANWEPIGQDTGGSSPITKFVVAADGSGDYTTIQDAINAANTAGGGSIYIRPGAFVESLTLYDNIELIGAVGEVDAGNISITGVHTPPAAGSVGFTSINLISATDVITSAAAGTTELTFNECIFTITNGYIVDCANWTGELRFNNCNSDGTNDGIINNTGGSGIFINNSQLGAGFGNTFTASGNVRFDISLLVCPATFTSTGLSEFFVSGFVGPLSLGSSGTYLAYDSVFFSTVTTAGTANTEIINSTFDSGATAAISHGSAGTFVIYNSTINSSNATPIGGAGAGVMTLGNITFPNNSAIANTLTIAYSRATDRISPYVVGATGNYETIQAAIDAANASGTDQTIFIQDGTYTEDLTLYDGINLYGNSYDNVIIAGAHTPPAAGTFIVQNCTLTSPTDIFTSAVAGTTIITVEQSLIGCVNGYLFDLVNWTGDLIVDDCGNIGTSDGFINNTGGSTIYITSATIGAGAGTFIATGATLIMYNSRMRIAGTLDGAGSLTADMGSRFEGTLTTAGTATVAISESLMTTGATAAISHGSAGVLSLSNSTIITSNNPAIDGAGAGLMTLSGIEFVDNNEIAATLTLSSTPLTLDTNLSVLKHVEANSINSENTYLPQIFGSPLVQSNLDTGVAPTGNNGDINILTLDKGTLMEQFIIGAQTIIAPRMNAKGLLISLDLTAGEGAEYNFGTTARSKHQYVIGTSPAFYIEASIEVASESGADPLYIGFRKTAADNATITNYTDFVGIGQRNSTMTGTVSLGTQIGGGGGVYTNCVDVWGNNSIRTLRVNVSATGVVTYLIDGAAPTATAAYTFTNGLTVMPYIHLVHSAGVPGAIYLRSLKVGLQ